MTPDRDDAGKMEARNYKLECLFKNQRPPTSGLSIVGLTAEEPAQPGSDSTNPYRRGSDPGGSVNFSGSGTARSGSFRTDTTEDTVVHQEDNFDNCGQKVVKRAEDAGFDFVNGAAGAEASVSGNGRCNSCGENEKPRVDDERSCCN
jgi:hypothetical protein